jgi:hypothetical protein
VLALLKGLGTAEVELGAGCGRRRPAWAGKAVAGKAGSLPEAMGA